MLYVLRGWTRDDGRAEQLRQADRRVQRSLAMVKARVTREARGALRQELKRLLTQEAELEAQHEYHVEHAAWNARIAWEADWDWGQEWHQMEELRHERAAIRVGQQLMRVASLRERFAEALQ